MTLLQGALIGVGFGSAVFILVLGCAHLIAWWEARKERRHG